ncbi:UNVERIFIED_ORG: hypothetical protein M2348_001100 [Sphingomonas sp. R1F5B]
MTAASWKPARCADCRAPWPSLSLNGSAGPWRCAKCHAVALASWTPPVPPQPAPAPSGGQQGQLL